ncbi:MAG: DUF3373 family protein [Candidatus Magnetomorum sp.]|nr:DUF3373 family protein [Candidatus Magnetomorum sp.]
MTIRLNRFLFFVMMIIVLMVYSVNAADLQKMTQEDYDIIKDKIIELKQRIKRLENKKQQVNTPEKLVDEIDKLSDEIEEYSVILDKVERKSFMDIVNLGAELRTQFDWYEFKGHDYEPYTEIKLGEPLHERVNTLPTNRLRLNLRAYLNETIKFTARINMIRHWSDDDFPIYPELNFLNTARKPSNLDLKVERAYIDFFFEPIENLPMALTFGRMPTTDGLPTDLKENTPRKSTYPGLAYDCETDGIAASVLLDEYLPLHHPAFRMLWIRRLDDNTQYFLGQKLSDKYGVYRNDNETMDTLNIYISQLETYLPDPFSRTLLMVNYLWIPNAPSSDLRYNPKLNQFYDTDMPLLYVDVPESEGELSKLTLFIESKNILNTGLDWFLDICFLKSKAKGALRFMFLPESLGFMGEPILARDAYSKYAGVSSNHDQSLKALTSAPPAIGLLNSDGVSDRNAQAIHLGCRYTLPLSRLNKPIVGCEYNHASRYWFGINAGSVDVLHKLDIRGSVWDFYYIQPINRNFLMRLAYTKVDYDYDEGMSFYHGEPMAIDHRISQISFMLDARF